MLAGENVIIRPTGHGVTFVQLDTYLDQIGRVTPLPSPSLRQARAIIRHGLRFHLRRRIRKQRKTWYAASARQSASSISLPPVLRGLLERATTRLSTRPNSPPSRSPRPHPAVFSRRELLQMGLLAAPEPIKIPAAFAGTSSNSRPWPSYQICLERAPKRKDGNPDRSRADFAYCLTAITGGRGVEETIAN